MPLCVNYWVYERNACIVIKIGAFKCPLPQHNLEMSFVTESPNNFKKTKLKI